MKEKYLKSLTAAENNRKILQRKNAFWDLFDSFHSFKPIRIWKKLLSFLRKFRFLSFLFQVIQWGFLLLQTGAAVIFTTLFFLILLPALFAFCCGILIAFFPEFRKANKKMKARLQGRRVYVLFYSGKSTPFFIWNLFQLANRENACVLLISPYWLLSKGIFEKNKSFFFTVRKEGENLYFLRRYYFFSLKKKILKSDQLCFIY